MVILTREQLEERLAALHQASLELVRDLSLEAVLHRIVSLAREQVGARYAALGVVDENGKLTQFIPIGMSPEEIRKTGPRPMGKGMLGALKKELRTIRIADIREDPRYFGFPEGHPNMHSFLGVPITSGDRLLGLIYLTNKEDHTEFTPTDERVIETLAVYAGVAITNARLYQGMAERDQALTERNEDLALINTMAAAMAGTLEIDVILEQTLARVMDHFSLEAGEIFLSEEGGHNLRLALHRGEAAELWDARYLRGGEGLIGLWLNPLNLWSAPTCGMCDSAPGCHRRRIPVDRLYPADLSSGLVGVMCFATRRSQLDPRDRSARCHRHLGRPFDRKRPPAPASSKAGSAGRARADWDGFARWHHPIYLRGWISAGLRPHRHR
jgi:signal transduction protein with GAF and PtsI domain